MAKKKDPRYECIAYLSVEAELDKVDRLEDKQLKYIKEYAKAHNILIVGVMRRHGFSMNDVFRNFRQIAHLIGKKRVEGVIVAGMQYVSSDLEDAYYKIGMIKAAGGQFVTVDEGNLGMDIVMEER
ncbi:MAG: recombinase family protein [Tyzzerella sp.]|mgnify:CR=1 FL=1|nr:recombinase family protein [Tyzzerella sp.]